MYRLWGTRIMDDRIRNVVRVVAIVLAVSAFVVLFNSVESEPAKADDTAPKPYGMVQHKVNTGPYDPGIATSKEKSPFYPSRASSGGRKVTSSMFDAPEVCGGCHTEIYKQWKGSMHSNAWTDPIYRAALNHISKGSGGAVDNLCMGCHTPIGVVTGEANPAGKNMSEIADRGVQCEVCHNISETQGIANGAYVLTPKLYGRPLKFGPFKDAQSPYHDTAYSQLHTQSEFCGQCHDVNHPFNRLPIERTYSEWKDSIYAGQGVQCQDCHMKPAPGKATAFSKEREKIYTHYFVGGNAIVTKLSGSDMHAEMAIKQLQNCAAVEMKALTGFEPGKSATVRVKVTNVGAGHKLPTGFPEGREMWLDFKVTDANGKTIYRLGAVKDGKTEPETRSFKVVLGDKNGNVVDLELLEADRILYDTRIPAKGFSENDYTFFVEPGTPGPLTVTADLNYWSVSPEWIARLMGDKAPKVPIIKMASTEQKVSFSTAKASTSPAAIAVNK